MQCIRESESVGVVKGLSYLHMKGHNLTGCKDIYWDVIVSTTVIWPSYLCGEGFQVKQSVKTVIAEVIIG